MFIGYELIHKKWSLNLKVGAGVSFLVKNKATYINYELSNFISPKPKKVVLNYIISPNINYQISNKIGLELTPQVIINSSSLINYNDVRQAYTNFGVNFGLNYSFNQL